MMKVSIKKTYKSITQLQEFEIPNFIVLTGKNGSGKSHLMELMKRTGDCPVYDDEGKQLLRIKYIPFGGLNPQIDEKCEFLNLTNTRKQAWNNVKVKLDEFESYKINNNWTIEQYLNSGGGRRNVLEKWVLLAGGDIGAITEEFFNEHYEITSDDILTGHIASIFKLYQIRFSDNDFRRFLNEKRGEQSEVLSDEDFETMYGPKPWVLVNDMLLRAGLTYQVNHPSEGERDLDFILYLTDVNSGVEINVNDLSTGEKVLMALALSIYNTKELTSRPDLLLIDEPDAALHPEYSKILVETIVEAIVKGAGVRVIISTHSPMTVALAPEDSIFLMDKTEKKPVKVSRQYAVNLLTKDLDNIRLSYENRRQVFVESRYDMQYYTRILSLVSHDLPTVPQFLPPKSSDGSNCDEVGGIVNELRRMGNDLVYGIKDFDMKNHSSDYVFVLGEESRYAIDNYVFDPIYVAFLLVHEGVLQTEMLGLPKLTYVQLRQLKDDEIQVMIDYVVKELNLSTGDSIEYLVQSGSKFKATTDYMMLRGHDLEAKIKDKWKPLLKHSKGGDYALKIYTLDRVFTDYPEFISMDFVDLFGKIV